MSIPVSAANITSSVETADYPSLLENRNVDLADILENDANNPSLQALLEYTLDEDGNILYNYEQTESVWVQHTNAGYETLANSDLQLLIIKARFGYNTKTKELTFNANVDCPSSLFNKPIVGIKLSLKKANTKNGHYSTAVPEIYLGKVNYLKDYTITYTGTNHYKFIIELYQIDDEWSILLPPSEHYVLLNRTGKPWDFYHTDPNSGVTISEPPSNWIANTTTQRDPNQNINYQKEYNRLYGTNIVVGTSTKTDVHHVQPLQFGGNNAMANLVHIDSAFHQKISAWFRGY